MSSLLELFRAVRVGDELPARRRREHGARVEVPPDTSSANARRPTSCAAMGAFALEESLPYDEMRSLSYEARQKLAALRPADVGPAASVPGVSPTDLQNLVIEIEKRRRRDATRPPPPSRDERCTESPRTPVGARGGGGAPGVRVSSHCQLASRWDATGHATMSIWRVGSRDAIATRAAASSITCCRGARQRLWRDDALDPLVRRWAEYPRLTTTVLAVVVVRPVRLVGADGCSTAVAARGRSRAALSGAHLRIRSHRRARWIRRPNCSAALHLVERDGRVVLSVPPRRVPAFWRSDCCSALHGSPSRCVVLSQCGASRRSPRCRSRSTGGVAPRVVAVRLRAVHVVHVGLADESRADLARRVRRSARARTGDCTERSLERRSLGAFCCGLALGLAATVRPVDAAAFAATDRRVAS
jgi:hypothetical protein